MTLEIRVRTRAREDLTEAASWYESQNPGLGSEFINEVERAFSQIADNPSGYRVIYRDTQRAMLQRFPFGIFYRISKQTVTVIAVMHSSRDPRRWMQRT